jgi:hypothetical protein
MQIIKPQEGKIQNNLFASRAREASQSSSLPLSLRICARVTLHSSNKRTRRFKSKPNLLNLQAWIPTQL